MAAAEGGSAGGMYVLEEHGRITFALESGDRNQRLRADSTASALVPAPEPPKRPRPVSSVTWVTLNISGVVFRTQKDTLKKVPGSLLYDLTESSPYYHAESRQYWFDRNPHMFQYILDFYRYGDLHFPHSWCGPLIKREIDFWEIEERHIGACCWNTYREFAEQKETLETLGSAFNDIDRFPKKKYNNCFFACCFRVRKGIWHFLEDPTSSVFAQIWAVLYVFMIVTSVLTLAVETHEYFRVELPSYNETLRGNTSNDKRYIREHMEPHEGLAMTELIISSLFAANLLLRFIVCPNKIHFMKSFMNWIDVAVVLSQWAMFAIEETGGSNQNTHVSKAAEMFRLIRVARVLLVFRLARHYTGLRILLLALRASVKEMMLLGVFMTIGMMIFSTLIYYAELSNPFIFPDIPTGFWWAIVTMTTVGYGDVHPQSHWGYGVGAICALSGMLATGLPIPIIANNFTFYYNVAKMKKRMDEREEISLSSEVFGKMKGMFAFGGNLVGNVAGKIGGAVPWKTDQGASRDDTNEEDKPKDDDDDDGEEPQKCIEGWSGDLGQAEKGSSHEDQPTSHKTRPISFILPDEEHDRVNGNEDPSGLPRTKPLSRVNGQLTTLPPVHPLPPPLPSQRTVQQVAQADVDPSQPRIISVTPLDI